MAKKRIRKLHYNKYSRKIIWLETKVNAKSYKTVGGYVRRLFRDDKNYQQLVERLERESPMLFDSPYSNLYGKKNDKRAILKFVTAHASTIYKDMKEKALKTHEEITIEKAIAKEFNTRAYVSNEELIQNNVRQFANRRNNKDFRDTLRALLGVQKIPWKDLIYDKHIKITIDAQGNTEEVKGYVFKGTNVTILSQGSGNDFSPYIFTIRFAESVTPVGKDSE